MGTHCFCSNFLLFEPLHSPAWKHQLCSPGAACVARGALGIRISDSSPRNHQKDVRIQPFATVAAALVLSPHPNQRGPKAFTVLPAKWVITERKRFHPKSRVDSPRPEGSTALLIEGKPETQHRFIAAIVPAHVSSSSLRQESCCLSQRSWTTAARLGQASECAHKVRSTDS